MIITITVAVVGGFFITEFLVNLPIVSQASTEAKRFAKEKEARKDKWMHGYVGCAMRKSFVTPITAEAFAWGQEAMDFVLPEHKATIPDHDAVMYGYWHATDYDVVEDVWVGEDPCKVKTTKTTTLPCYAICDKLQDEWDRLNELEGTEYEVYNIYENPLPDIPEDYPPPIMPIDPILFASSVAYQNQNTFNHIYSLYLDEKEELQTGETNIQLSRMIGRVEINLTKLELQKVKYVNAANVLILKDYANNLKEEGKSVQVFRYLLNKNKKEIHNLRRKSHLCNVNLIKEDHVLYMSNLTYVRRLLKTGYDGCKHCMTEFHRR